MITAAIIGRSSSHYFPISRALTTLHLPTTTAQPILPSCYPQNSSSFSYHLSFRRNHIIDTMTRSSLLAVTTTCTQLVLLIGGIQSFATPFNHHRNNDLTNNNHQKGTAKKDFKLWSQATDKSSSGEAILDLSEGRSSGSVLTDLVTNGAPKEKEEACSDDTTNNEKTTDDVADVITKQPISTTPPTTTTSGTKIIATDDQFIKSLPDKRNYRAITLPNQLTVLLTSDPMTDVESASVHVRAGHFDDPPNRAGLAHFHEHMLFLGTEKYPKEEEYEDFLGRNGGASNAYTDMEDTNYYFNVSPLDHSDDDDEETSEEVESESVDNDGKVSSALSGALDRFAQFFISPLFDEAMLERELRAVNSEYLNGRTADNWRNYQMLKHLSNHDHPFSKFGCGNYNTLTDGGDPELKGEEKEEEGESSLEFGGGSSPREALVQFWTDKYHAGNIRLCVVGRAGLDELQKTVEQAFGDVRPPPEGFVANGLVDQFKAGVLKLPEDGESHKRDENGDFVFQTEHLTYAPNVAFGPNELGLIREVIPLVESRSLKILSAVPPSDDPVLAESKPFRVLSHLVGHESPGSLHHLLMEEGWVSSLSSGTGVAASDFSLTSLGISLTPKGMRERDQVLAKTWQWLALIKDAVLNDPHGVIEQYHNEMKVLADTSFKFRENGDPTNFCSSAAERLFDYEPSKLLLGSAEAGDYDVEVARAFLKRMTPENSLIIITGPELGEKELEEAAASAGEETWQTEDRYGGKYRQVRISEDLAKGWNQPAEIDPRLRLPGLNEFIPEDLSLRCDDEESKAAFDPEIDYREQHPDLIVDTPKLRMWHKMDRTFRVPKSSIRLQLTSPNIYRTPRTITLNRIFQKVLQDDLNSYVYDASVAGCNYRVSVAPSYYALSVSGYSEKLPHLLDVVTSRIASLIEEMKEGEEAHPALEKLFSKSKDDLLRQTKNYVYDSPYETATYNFRMLCETPVWHVKDYIGEMEGPEAEAEPLSMKECAEAAEECLFGRTKAVSLCIGNIDEKGSKEVADLISNNFLKKRPLSDDETPRFRSLRMPSKAEAMHIFGESVGSREVPIVYEDLAHSEDEENNAVDLMMQTASSFELGFEGLALQELIVSLAYNSAFNQLRTKEQLGYIVAAVVKKSTGGGNGLHVIVQSSSTLPPELEERCLRWVEQFRKELEEMPDSRFAMEAAAVKANLLEKDIKLAEEISSVWGEILSTVPHSEHFKNPDFDRIEKFADVLTLDDKQGNGSDSPIKTAAQLKEKVLEFYDKYFSPDSPDRRVVSSRVYNRKAKAVYEENIGTPGFISSYNDSRKLKQMLTAFPTAPYW